jgi:hypothetical protein
MRFLFDVAWNALPWAQYIGDYASRLAESVPDRADALTRIHDFAAREVKDEEAADTVLSNMSADASLDGMAAVSRARIVLERALAEAYDRFTRSEDAAAAGRLADVLAASPLLAPGLDLGLAGGERGALLALARDLLAASRQRP